MFNIKSNILVIGGTNIDIKGYSFKKIIKNDKNPGHVNINFGGVGRNITENLSNILNNISFISVFGDDVYGEKIKKDLISKKVDISNSIFLKDTNTSIYLSIFDNEGELNNAISDMDIMDEMNKDFLETKKDVINDAKFLIVDANLSEDSLKYIANNFKTTNTVVDLVSVTKAQKLKDIIGCFHTIKPNRSEAEILVGFEIKDEIDMHKASKIFLDKGVKNVFMTLGDKGVFYMNSESYGLLPGVKINVVDVTGAGDSFTAGIVYGMEKGYNILETAKIAQSFALLTLQSETTVLKDMNEEKLLKMNERW